MVVPILRVEDLWLRRNGHEILRGVNLEVLPGLVHVLLGLNGSGKSSLAYTLMGCEGYVPDLGRILFDDQDLTGLSITERARLGITLAWQEPARFEGIPIGKYVGFGQKDANREQVVAVLEAVYAMRPRLAILAKPDSGIDVLTLGEIAR